MPALLLFPCADGVELSAGLCRALLERYGQGNVFATVLSLAPLRGGVATVIRYLAMGGHARARVVGLAAREPRDQSAEAMLADDEDVEDESVAFVPPRRAWDRWPAAWTCPSGWCPVLNRQRLAEQAGQEDEDLTP